MKLRFATLLSLLSVFALPFLQAQPSDEQETLFQLGMGLMLTEQYLQAEACFVRLLEMDPENVEAHTNRGINFAYWALNKMTEAEAETLIRYVFPFEIAAQLGTKGVDSRDSLDVVLWLLESAKHEFDRALELAPKQAGLMLNQASIMAMLSRWKQDSSMLKPAFQMARKAKSAARAGSATAGYALVVQGIIYDYMGQAQNRDRLFREAEQQFGAEPDSRIARFISRNQTAATGVPIVRTLDTQEKYDTWEDPIETIDGLSLTDMMEGHLTGLSPYLQVDLRKPITYSVDRPSETEGTSLPVYQRDFPQSTLFLLYKDKNHYHLFHRTSSGYDLPSALKVAVGENEATVRTAYGEPACVQPTNGGKLLLFQEANVLFFLDDRGLVESWMLYQKKGR